MGFEMDFLYALQSIQSPWLSSIMIFASFIDTAGFVWGVIGVVLLVFKKTRRCGGVLLLATAFSFLLGNIVLKNLFERERPFLHNPAISLLISPPRGYSFPSGHTLNSFTAATVLFIYFKKAGVGAFLLAILIGFSRMYLFVHFPTDILGGIILGIFDAILISYLVNKVLDDRKKTQRQFDN